MNRSALSAKRTSGRNVEAGASSHRTPTEGTQRYEPSEPRPQRQLGACAAEEFPQLPPCRLRVAARGSRWAEARPRCRSRERAAVESELAVHDGSQVLQGRTR